jgi:hypothetical protein
VVPPLQDWKDTFTTLHMWTQVLGKIRLELAPCLNHSWGSTLYVTTRGLTTSPIPERGRSFAIDFDFVDHALQITTSGRRCAILRAAADVRRRLLCQDDERSSRAGCRGSDLHPTVEVEEAIRFEEDHRHASYDPQPVQLFWRAMVQAQRVLTEFRARFIGKTSPVHFFWGGFDLAVTRFSGRTAPKHPGGVPNCADWVMQEAYSHQVSSAGFWPGNGLGGQEVAAFYAYAYPVPAGFENHPVRPEAAFFHARLGSFVLPYESVRTAETRTRRSSLFSRARTKLPLLAEWDRPALERQAAVSG